ncbi:hypothetical protein [Streptomyces sp. NPDC001770]
MPAAGPRPVHGRRNRQHRGFAGCPRVRLQPEASAGSRLVQGAALSDARPEEHGMADVVFVVTTIAVFALVILIARGVAKL